MSARRASASGSAQDGPEGLEGEIRAEAQLLRLLFGHPPMACGGEQGSLRGVTYGGRRRPHAPRQLREGLGAAGVVGQVDDILPEEQREGTSSRGQGRGAVGGLQGRDRSGQRPKLARHESRPRV
jgi:hypothetical protein